MLDDGESPSIRIGSWDAKLGVGLEGTRDSSKASARGLSVPEFEADGGAGSFV